MSFLGGTDFFNEINVKYSTKSTKFACIVLIIRSILIMLVLIRA